MPLPTATGVTPLTGAGLPVDPPGATRFRLASPTTGVVLAVLTLAMAAACLVLGSLTGDPQDDLASNALGVGPPCHSALLVSWWREGSPTIRLPGF
jgi:hypothetical protein